MGSSLYGERRRRFLVIFNYGTLVYLILKHNYASARSDWLIFYEKEMDGS